MSTDPFGGDAESSQAPRSDDVIERGIEALQAAATEAIAAARAVLDVAEELVADPRTAAAVTNLLGSVPRVRPRPRRDDDGGEDGVQRIPVS
jgi:hypothetical protein